MFEQVGSMLSRVAGPAERQLRTAGLDWPQPLAGKLQSPAFTFPVLRRARLTELIDQATRHRVTLVSGPAGTGKTVACASWAAAGVATRQVVWLTLERDDSPWLWAYIWAGLARIGAVPAEALEALADAAADVFPFRLAEAAHLFTDPVVLVLDDVHTVTADDAVRSGLRTLARHGPPTLRLVLSGRPPGPSVAQPRFPDVAQIGEADLAWTADEAAALSAMSGVPGLAV